MKLVAKIIDKADLTDREAQVFALLCSGETNKGISRSLDISIKVVEKHVDHIYEKLDVRWKSINARCTAIGIAVSKGMVKIMLNCVVLVLVIQASVLNEDAMMRSRLRVPRVSRVKRREN